MFPKDSQTGSQLRVLTKITHVQFSNGIFSLLVNID